MFGHRSDGYLVKDIDPIVALTPYIMPMRCDAQVMSDYKVDFEKLARYIVAKADEGYKITFMEIVIAAYVRVVSQIPEVNRFVSNKRLYARNELAVSFALLQTSSTGKIAENTTKCNFDPADTIYDVADRIAEGAMYAKMLALWNKLLNDPVQLEQPPAKVFYDEGHEYHLPAPQKRMGKVNAGTAVQA